MLGPNNTWSESHEQTKIKFITYIYILYCLSSINFQFSYNLAGFLDILNYTRHKRGLGTAKTQNSRAKCHDDVYTHDVSKQTTLLDGVDVGLPK